MSRFLRKLFQRVPRGGEGSDSDDDDILSPDGNVAFNCSSFLRAMKVFRDHLNDTTLPKEQLFQLPEHLKDLVHVFFFHEVLKKVEFQNVPENTQYVDMIRHPDKEIAFINRLVWDTTNGLFEKLDAATESQLHSPEFRYLLLGIFYLKAKWNGVDDGRRVFFNENQEVPIVPYFCLENCPVKFMKKRIYVRVPYERGDQDTKVDAGSFVVFSMPCSSWDPQYERVNVHLPKLNVEGRQETDVECGKIVLQFKYKQDEQGFEAACLYAEDGVDGISKPVKDVYFNQPFKIKIYSQHVKVFQVQVYNLK